MREVETRLGPVEVLICNAGVITVGPLGLFLPLSATPATTVSARRAARRIVMALRRGDAEITLGLHAKLAARMSGLAPRTTASVLGVLARALPEVHGTNRRRGSEIESPLDHSRLTALGPRAAEQLNQ